jgi:hypothetical protein
MSSTLCRSVIIRAKRNKHLSWAVECVVEVPRKFSLPMQCPDFARIHKSLAAHYDEVAIVENVE